MFVLLAGHPWFPGVVFEPDDDDIPEDILNTYNWFCQEAKLDKEEMKQVQIVRFWDKNMSWFVQYFVCFLSSSSLYLLNLVLSDPFLDPHNLLMMYLGLGYILNQYVSYAIIEIWTLTS
jgi:hypothetical protein